MVKIPVKNIDRVLHQEVVVPITDYPPEPASFAAEGKISVF
jgi:hypothetical protein